MFSSDSTDSNSSGEQNSISENVADQDDSPKQRILIGSQRNPEAYRPKPAVQVVNEDGAPIVVTESNDVEKTPQQAKPALKTGGVVFSSEVEPDVTPEVPPASPKSEVPKREQDQRSGDGSRRAGQPNPGGERQGDRNAQRGRGDRRPRGRDDSDENSRKDALENEKFSVPLRSNVNIPLPTLRGNLSDDLQEEFEELFGGDDLESLMANVDQIAAQAQIETETKQTGKIISIGKESVFIELGGREQGAIPLKQFKAEPQVGQSLEVVVVRFLEEEGLYDLSLPLAAADVSDWSQIENGMVVEARITAHNTGGLECEVNRLRAFIPMSQISMYRVEKPQEFVGQKLMCLVTECNPMRRNLVLSARALLEREREQNRQKLLDELEIGQIRDGLVRKLIDAGAFVDLGGIDGFIPISALSWGRVKHPSDVISEGQMIKVKVTRKDLEKNRISLSFRDDAADPWSNIEAMFPERSTARGKISKIMDFGAFVELMPGVEGLIHISELSHKRVARVSEVVQEGDWVDVFVQSVDKTNKRLGLSMKQLMADPRATEALPEEDQSGTLKPEVKAPPVKARQQHKGPLKGGIGGQGDGEKFGLKF